MESLPEQSAFDGKRIVCFGPESTGKSRLTQELSAHYDEPSTREYMREYLQEKWDKSKLSCTYDDLVPITAGQIRWENEASQYAEKLLFCDTNPLQLKVYAHAYYDQCPQVISDFIENASYAHYLLLDIDVEWVDDDLRDKPDERQFMFQKFRRELNSNNLPYTVINGQGEKRLANAIRAINKLID